MKNINFADYVMTEDEKENLIETYERRIQELKSAYDLEKLKYSAIKRNDPTREA